MLKRIAAVALLHLLLVYTIAARIGDNADWGAKQQVRNVQVSEITLCTTVAANALHHTLHAENYNGGWSQTHSPIKGLLVDVNDLLRVKNSEIVNVLRRYTLYCSCITYTPLTDLIFPFHYFT